jgi:glycogen debranching enzyme
MEAARHFEYDRLPELFCGYDTSAGRAVKYPVACSPQAWAAGTPLVFIQTILGLFPDAMKKEIHLSPKLLNDMNELKAEKIKIGSGHLSLHVSREGDNTHVVIEENTTGYEVIYQEQHSSLIS